MKNLTLALALAFFATAPRAELHLLDNFKCESGQRVEMAPENFGRLVNQNVKSEFAATNCYADPSRRGTFDNQINKVNAKRQLEFLVTPTKTDYFRVYTTPVAGAFSNVGTDTGLCTLHYIFDAKAVSSPNAKVMVTLAPVTGMTEIVAIKLYNNSEALSFINAAGNTTRTFFLSDITIDADTAGITHPVVSTLASFDVITSCRSTIYKVYLDDGQQVLAAAIK